MNIQQHEKEWMLISKQMIHYVTKECVIYFAFKVKENKSKIILLSMIEFPRFVSFVNYYIRKNSFFNFGMQTNVL